MKKCRMQQTKTRHRDFVCERQKGLDGETLSSLGWRPVGTASFDAREGHVVAHDVMEHHDYRTECHAQEMMAISCMAWGRQSQGYFSSGNDAYAYDIEAFCAELVHEPKYIAPAPKFDESRMEDEDREMLARALNLCRRSDRFDAEENPDEWERYRAALRMSIPWLKFGFIRARERYDHITPFYFVHMFREIEEAVDRIAMEEGKRIRVTADFKAKETAVVVLHDDWY